MKRFLLPLLGSAAALTFSAAAIAQAGDGPRPEMTRAVAEQRAAKAFARMDANSDGRIDTADRAARQQQRFDRLDTDGNGSLSRAEFASSTKKADGDRAKRPNAARKHGARVMGMVHKADGNGDGTVTKAEFTAAALARFDRVDADRDGTVSAAEREAAREAGHERRKQRTQRPG